MTSGHYGENIEHAFRKMKENRRGLEAVRKAVLHRFYNKCPLSEVCIVYENDNKFRAVVFFNTNEEVIQCTAQGVTKQIEQYIYDELERVGRGGRDQIVVIFEWDSDENVKTNYQGSYYFRLH